MAADTGYIGRSSVVCRWYKGLMLAETVADTDGQMLLILKYKIKMPSPLYRLLYSRFT